jgi:hypothetical protein
MAKLKTKNILILLLAISIQSFVLYKETANESNVEIVNIYDVAHITPLS